jgi:low affinity Fe/Cu permease
MGAQRERILPRTRQLSPSSRWLYHVDHYSSLPVTSFALAALLLASIVTGAILGFSSGWLTGFEVVTATVTLLMVFVIQHTQGREQSATQRKLDELLRALPEAESGLMMLEEASDERIRDVELDQRESREQDQDLAEGPASEQPQV